jgi:class 3 adenylate cyclase/TolB-like protein/Tfp pilus assembly protein PilF
MSDSHLSQNDFLDKITEIIEENIANDQFGVSELAFEISMSRSNLLRKIKKLTKLSASQFISQVRLKKAMEILKTTSLTISEVSFKVGFSSTSYFIKCFRDFYGYPPGEAGKRGVKESDSEQTTLPSQNHQLAAIMFTDIEGYTALMQRDEATAIEFRNRHREVFNAVTKKYHGKILQYYGDGTLSTFTSAIDAVRCAIEMQLAFQGDPHIPVRIGIHTGDIIVSKEDIIGDGVNVAARIESLAAVGSIYISEKVYDEVKNQSGIQTISMGVFELKNVEKPIEVFAITNPGLVIPEREEKLKDDSGNGDKGYKTKVNKIGFKWIFIPIATILVMYLVYSSNIFEKINQVNTVTDLTNSKKSIAVIPFINDSNDSTNIYIINGLMESTLNNLQKIKNLRVISRTSTEKYRNNVKSIPEIARELNVKYIVAGSGQKIGDQILLNIQLIDAEADKHLWSEQYQREAKDIFELQMEVAKNIADKIEVIITPEEVARMNKLPTNDLVAYDYFLKGLDLLNKPIPEYLDSSIVYFEQAIEHDNQFARAYAAIAMAYFLLDEGHAEKKYAEKINYHADQALLFDSQLPQSLIAKALFYMHSREYELAESYFEKALEYNPNYDLVFVFLVKLYVDYLPNTEKYLEYALRGLEIDISAYDSIIKSFSYLHISNAFIQSGFIKEAEKYINKSLEYYPDNLFSEYVKAYILYAKNRDIQQTKQLLIEALNKDSTRLDILQEIGKINYFMRDYESAAHYYNKYIQIKDLLKLDIYNTENAKIGFVFSMVGQTEESEKYLLEFKDYAENDKSIYKHISLAAYYSFYGDEEKAIEHLKLFSDQEHYHYWTIIFIHLDPLFDNLRDLPEFKAITNDLETKFWQRHEQIKLSLEEKELI